VGSGYGMKRGGVWLLLEIHGLQ